MISLDVCDVQIDLLLQHDQLLVHLNLQIIASCFNFCFHLYHFFLLISKQCFALVLGVLLFQIFNTLRFLDFESFELFPVIHSFINSLIDSDKLFVVLHDLQFCVGFDFARLNSSIKFSIQSFHLLFMRDLQVLNPEEGVILILLELHFPIIVKVLHMFFTDLHIFSHLSLLNVLTKLVLKVHDFSFEKTHFFHKVLVKLILVDLAALLGEQLHFFFGNGKDQHLLVFVEDTVSTHVKHLNELLWGRQSQEIVDVITSLLIDKSNVCIIQKAFFPEICTPDGLPDFFALSGASNEWTSLTNQLFDFMLRHVGQA